MAPKKGRSAVPTGSCGTDEKHRLRCRLRIPLLHDECNTGPARAARSRAQARRRAAVRGPLPPLCGNAKIKEVFSCLLFNPHSIPCAAFPGRLSDAAREVRRTASLAGAAMLAALSLVLNQFTIAVSQFLEIGFSFLAAGTCAFLYGPWLAGLMGIVTDVVGYFLRPNGGFFPGFTLNEFLLGFLYGCWLYKKPVSLWRTFCACLSAVLVINLVLTPLWLNIMYGNAFVISGMRLIKNAVKLPLDTALLYFLLKAVETHRKKAL